VGAQGAIFRDFELEDQSVGVYGLHMRSCG
jgi:hypothetical protein